MVALFYDRKNHCLVRSNELMQTRVIADVIQGDPQEQSMMDKPIDILMQQEDVDGHKFPGLLSWHKMTIGELGYKTAACPSYMNFDRHLMQSDLVFLEMIE